MPRVGADKAALYERLIYAYDGTDYRVVKCDTDGNVVAAIKASQIITVTQDTASNLQATVTIPTGQDILARLQGYYGASWRNAPVHFGVGTPYAETKSNTSLPSGTTSLTFSTVASNTVRVVTGVMICFQGTTPTYLQFNMMIGGVTVMVYRHLSPTSLELYSVQGWWVLDTGDYIVAYIAGATAGDKLYAYCVGFEFSVA